MLDSQILKEKPYLAVIDFDEKPKIEDFKVDLADRIINKKEMKYFRLPSQESEIEYAKVRRENTSLQLLKVIQFVRRNKDECSSGYLPHVDFRQSLRHIPSDPLFVKKNEKNRDFALTSYDYQRKFNEK